MSSRLKNRICTIRQSSWRSALAERLERGVLLGHIAADHRRSIEEVCDMADRLRLELHFDDERVEVADDLAAARRIASKRPDNAAEVWAVSPNDLGVGWRVEHLGATASADRPDGR
jgi:hypothetical protein